MRWVTPAGELTHYGVLGMKWGVRKQRRKAKKDAKEYVTAKQCYGKGAGTRRKQIKAVVEQRKIRDFTSAAEFRRNMNRVASRL